MTDTATPGPTDTPPDTQLCAAADVRPDAAADGLSDVAPGSLTVFTAGIGRKIQPTTSAGKLDPVALAGPRRSVQSFQIVIVGQGGALSKVTATVIDLDDGKGHTLSAGRVTLFREWFIDYGKVSAAGGTTPVPASSPSSDSRLPEPLIPLIDPYSSSSGTSAGQPFSVESGQNQPIFVDVELPLGTAAGTYQGEIVVADGTNASHVPFSVEVWNLAPSHSRAVVDEPGVGGIWLQAAARSADCTCGLHMGASFGDETLLISRDCLPGKRWQTMWRIVNNPGASHESENRCARYLDALAPARGENGKRCGS